MNHDTLMTPDARRRQLLLLLTSLATTGCVTPLPEQGGRPLPEPAVLPPVRAPSTGQSWTYGVHNGFNGQALDTLTETVLSVDGQIRIGRTSAQQGPLAEEIQSPWGMILQDPHWKPRVLFSEALPLWPPQFKPGWSGDFYTRYQIPELQGSLFDWRLTMKAVGWETLTVPAGTFKALRYSNHIRFQSHEFYYRLTSERTETLWLVPELGRWVLRRSSGVYYIEGFGSRMREDDLEWALLSWNG